MRNVTLRQLRVFESVARHLSFSRAAEEQHLTQPAVSMQVKALEEQAGLPLFEQIVKKIFLTEAGKELHVRCRAVSDELPRPRKPSRRCAESNKASSPSGLCPRASISCRSSSAGSCRRTLA